MRAVVHLLVFAAAVLLAMYATLGFCPRRPRQRSQLDDAGRLFQLVWLRRRRSLSRGRRAARAGNGTRPVDFDVRNADDVESMGLYWHFVDIVWIVIFTAVYLLEYVFPSGPVR